MADSKDSNKDTQSTKLYRLKSGSITRYEGDEKDGTRKVVTYESSGQSTGEAGGNLVRLTEREVQAVGFTRLEEVHGYGDAGQGQGQDHVAVVAPATSLTGAPAGVPLSEKEQQEAGQQGVVDGDRGVVTSSEPEREPVRVDEIMSSAPTTTTTTSNNPAVERVLAKKAASAK